MSYFIAAGIIGLGIVGYKRRKDLLYNALNIYTNIEESFNKNKNSNSTGIITYYYMKDSKLCETNNLEELNELNNYILQKVEIENKIFHNLYKNQDEEIITEISYFNKFINLSSQILACTFNLSNKEKKLLDEYDITKLIDSFIFGEKNIYLNEDLNFIIVNYIKYFYKLKFELPNYENFDNVKLEYIFLDKNVEMHKGDNVILNIKNDNLIIKKHN